MNKWIWVLIASQLVIAFLIIMLFLMHVRLSEEVEFKTEVGPLDTLHLRCRKLAPWSKRSLFCIIVDKKVLSE